MGALPTPLPVTSTARTCIVASSMARWTLRQPLGTSRSDALPVSGRATWPLHARARAICHPAGECMHSPRGRPRPGPRCPCCLPPARALRSDVPRGDQKMQRPTRAPVGQLDGQRLLAPAERRDVRHRPVQPCELQQARHEAGRLPEQQAKQDLHPSRDIAAQCYDGQWSGMPGWRHRCRPAARHACPRAAHATVSTGQTRPSETRAYAAQRCRTTSSGCDSGWARAGTCCPAMPLDSRWESRAAFVQQRP